MSKLPAIFTDHAVLQRDMPVPVWGWAEPGEEVTVAIAGQTQKAKADDKGKWRVTLEPLSVGEPLTLVVEEARIGWKRTTSSSAKSGCAPANRTWSGRCAGDERATWRFAAANHPHIRLVRVKGPGSQTPVEDFKGDWQVCTPESVAGFSAVGYFFGRELHDQLDVPIGLIDDSWGGSACEAWIRRDRMEGKPSMPAAQEMGRADQELRR